MRPKIKFSNVSKSFNLYKKQSDKLKEIFSLKRDKNNFFALNNLSFEIFEGETIGIVGLNGSGKSTLSNLLAQVIPPTSGSIEINGETSLIAISAGLNPQLTGMENIDLKCLMHGLKKDEIEKLKPQIIEFADIGKFINQPVKNYSSGMKSRLGFAISINTNPDILIVDEALSVGDQTFYEKCLVKMNDFKKQGKTIIFISHSLSQVKAFCDRVMWIHFGKIEKFDRAEMVVEEYNKFIKWFNALNESDKKKIKSKMLDDQYTGQDHSLSRLGNRSKPKPTPKKKNFLFSVQVLLLVIAILFTASFLFGTNPVQKIGKWINKDHSNQGITVNKDPGKEVSGEIATRVDKVQKINKAGIVLTGSSVLYDGKQLKTKVKELPFSENVFVINQLGDTYKIRTEDHSIGYTNSGNIQVLEDDLPVSQTDLTEFLPIFPERFTDAYSYFLTFLNEDSEEVTSKLRGSTEDTLASGEKTLTFSIYNAQYFINKDGKAESIRVSNIDPTNGQWDKLKEKASLKSKDHQYYYFNLGQYKVVIDLINNEAIISPENQ